MEAETAASVVAAAHNVAVAVAAAAADAVVLAKPRAQGCWLVVLACFLPLASSLHVSWAGLAFACAVACAVVGFAGAWLHHWTPTAAAGAVAAGEKKIVEMQTPEHPLHSVEAWRAET